VRNLPDRKIGSHSNCRYCADRVQNLPGSPNFGPHVLDFIQIGLFFGRVIAERVKAVLSTIGYLHDSPPIHSRRIGLIMIEIVLKLTYYRPYNDTRV